MKYLITFIFVFSSFAYAEVFEGKAEFLDSTEVTLSCPEGGICFNPYLHRYKVTAISTASGKELEVIAAYRHSHRHDTSHIWQFELLKSEGHSEQDLIKAEWVISNLTVLVNEQVQP